MPAEMDVCQAHPGSVRLRLSKATWGISFKHLFDFIVALHLLVLMAPLMALAALLVKLTSPGPMVYSQTRLGRKGKPYRILKIRTMLHDCETLTGPQWSTPGDSRVTPIGRFLRRTHLDELPQLWNVLKGDMSLVGPRPERPEFATHLEKVIPYYQERLLIRPGVTGLAQVQLPGDSDLESVRRKLSYDLYYVENMNPMLDSKIIGSTVFKMLGFSYETMRKLFRLPEPHVIAENFDALPAEEAKPSPPQPNATIIQVSALNPPSTHSVQPPTTPTSFWTSVPFVAGRIL
jgi:lipopolysaccharide/colanic/teichoic acid biosynthesis glycosyltransferase